MTRQSKLAYRSLLVVGTLLGCHVVINQASAQDFSNTIFIGDSNSDNGRFKYLPDPISGSTHVTGAYTTSPDLMWSEVLGQKFNIPVVSSAAPGGGNNYAAGGATVATPNGGQGDVDFANEWSGVQQVTAYLTDVGNKADANALYTVFIGNNDLHSWFNLAPGLDDLVDDQVSYSRYSPLSLQSNVISLADRQTAIIALAGQTANLVEQLHNAGGRYFLVPGDYTIGSQAAADAVNYFGKTGVNWEAAPAAAIQLYNSSMWNQIAAKGINFIPADFFTVANYVILNPTGFGVTNLDWTQPVCGGTPSIDCTPADWVSGRTGANSLFADDNGHLAGVGQQIEADYSYGLITAPAEVSTLANQAYQTQVSKNDTYLSRIDGSFRATAPGTIGYWVLGGADHRDLDESYPRYQSLTDHEALGVDYQYSANWLLGGYFGYGTSRTDLNNDGHFEQSGATLGGYASFRAQGFWAQGTLNYNWLSTDLQRVTPVGLVNFSNTTDSIGGANFSAALDAGYSFHSGVIDHGPIAGYQYINTAIDSFTETDNFNALHFNQQAFANNIVSGGYKVKAALGRWEPSMKATYNSLVGRTDRNVTAALTTVTAPSYSMPAVAYPHQWVNVTASLGYKLNEKLALQADFSNRIAEGSLLNYGGTIAIVGRF